MGAPESGNRREKDSLVPVWLEGDCSTMLKSLCFFLFRIPRALEILELVFVDQGWAISLWSGGVVCV